MVVAGDEILYFENKIRMLGILILFHCFLFQKYLIYVYFILV